MPKKIYEKEEQIQDIDGNEVTLKLQAIHPDEKNLDMGMLIQTHGTIKYPDGTEIELTPIVSGKDERYIWQDGFIFIWMRNNVLDKKVFDIKEKSYREISFTQRYLASLKNNATRENTSIAFESIKKLANGNRLLVHRYWGGDGSLNENYHLLNAAGQVFYIGARTLASPDEYAIFEGIIWDDNCIYFYYADSPDDITITHEIDITSGTPIDKYKRSSGVPDTEGKIRRLIREKEQKNKETSTDE